MPAAPTKTSKSSSHSSKPPKPSANSQTRDEPKGGSKSREERDRGRDSSSSNRRKAEDTWSEKELMGKLGGAGRSGKRSVDDSGEGRKREEPTTRKRGEETAEQRAERKLRERRAAEQEEEKERQRGDSRHNRRREETEEERAERKRREKREKEKKEREREKGELGDGDNSKSRDKSRREETAEERAERKRRERERRQLGGEEERGESETRRQQKRRPQETSTERAERKRREKEREEGGAVKGKREEETEEERHERKRRERAERKAREKMEQEGQQQLEADQKKAQVDEKSADIHRQRSRRDREEETSEQRAERKRREKEKRRQMEDQKEHVIGEDSSGKHRKRSSEEKSSVAKGSAVESGVHNQSNDYNDAYEDDFEEFNYDDDFEPDQSRESFEKEESSSDRVSNDHRVQQQTVGLMEADENKRRDRSESPDREKRRSVREKDYFSSFSVVSCKPNLLSAAKRHAVVERMKQRSFSLLNRIELDYFCSDMFNLNPLSEYEMFMRKFGYSDTTQVACQTRDEDAHIETQTEPADLCHSWVQHPASGSSGASRSVQQTESEPTSHASYTDLDEGDKMSKEDTELAVVTDTRKLNKFLVKSSNLVSNLLGSRQTLGQAGKAKSFFEIADTFSSLILSQGNEFLAKKEVVTMTSNNYKVVVCLRVLSSDFLLQKGLLCVFSNVSLKAPSHYLACFSELTCCAITQNQSLTGSPVVFAGGNDGIIYMWDLNRGDPVKVHVEGNQPVDLQLETYSTALSSNLSSHTCPIKHVLCIEPEHASLNFQICSVDESGELMFWTYHLCDSNEQELTLLPGSLSKISLCHHFSLSQLDMHALNMSIGSTGTVNRVAFSPLHPSRAFFASGSSAIVQADCFIDSTVPKLYQCSGGAAVTHIEFCPVASIELFVACCSDGVISLFSPHRSDPLISYTCVALDPSSCCIQCLWSENFPMLLFVLTTRCVLVLDVTNLCQGSLSHCQLRDYSSPPVAISIWKNSATKRFVLAVAYESGDFEFHDLLHNFMKIQSPVEQGKVLDYFVKRELLPKLQ